MRESRHCPAVLIAAPASGQGKTTVTAALARLHRNQGRKVRVFKCGPDFLDPMILERASGAPVYQVDLWMVGADESRLPGCWPTGWALCATRSCLKAA